MAYFIDDTEELGPEPVNIPVENDQNQINPFDMNSGDNDNFPGFNPVPGWDQANGREGIVTHDDVVDNAKDTWGVQSF